MEVVAILTRDAARPKGACGARLFSSRGSDHRVDGVHRRRKTQSTATPLEGGRHDACGLPEITTLVAETGALSRQAGCRNYAIAGELYNSGKKWPVSKNSDAARCYDQ